LGTSKFSRDEDISSAGSPVVYAGFARFFDIVNGFFNRCRGAWIQVLTSVEARIDATLTDVNLAEIIVRTYYSAAAMQGCC